MTGCPHVIQSFALDITAAKKGDTVYNLFLEFASGESLMDLIESYCAFGSPMPDCLVCQYTRSILSGLKHVHEHGFVHCDIKPDNILLVPIADGFDVKLQILGWQRGDFCEGDKVFLFS